MPKFIECKHRVATHDEIIEHRRLRIDEAMNDLKGAKVEYILGLKNE